MPGWGRVEGRGDGGVIGAGRGRRTDHLSGVDGIWVSIIRFVVFTGD